MLLTCFLNRNDFKGTDWMLIGGESSSIRGSGVNQPPSLAASQRIGLSAISIQMGHRSGATDPVGVFQDLDLPVGHLFPSR